MNAWKNLCSYAFLLPRRCCRTAAKRAVETPRVSAIFAKLGVGVDDVALVSDGGPTCLARFEGSPRLSFSVHALPRHCP